MKYLLDTDICVYWLKEIEACPELVEGGEWTHRARSCFDTLRYLRTGLSIVCGRRGARIVIITVYVPKPPKFIDPWTRSGTHGR